MNNQSIALSNLAQNQAKEHIGLGSVLVVCPTEEFLSYTALGLQKLMGDGWEIESTGQRVRNLFKAGEDHHFLFVSYNDFSPTMLATLVFESALLVTATGVEPYVTVNLAL